MDATAALPVYLLAMISANKLFSRGQPGVSPMDRSTWLAERRAAVVADYDAEAPTYDMDLYPADTQEEWVARLLTLIPLAGTVLDAPCGTGRYFFLITGAGMRGVGADQSAGMLA